MSYAEAAVKSGVSEQPTWVLRDILERLDRNDAQAEAIRVILSQR